jgi:hypothetical protein
MLTETRKNASIMNNIFISTRRETLADTKKVASDMQKGLTHKLEESKRAVNKANKDIAVLQVYSVEFEGIDASNLRLT